MENVNIAEQIRVIVELQELDKEIYRLRSVIEGAPEKTKELDDGLENKKAALKAAEDELKKLQMEHKEKEGELGTKEGAIKKYQTQQNLVKTNKEYSSLEKEIASIKADNSLLEEAILKSFDTIEAAQKTISKEKQKFEEEKQKTGSQKNAIEVEKKAAEAEMANLNEKRTAFTEKIDKGILDKYERVLANRSGLAVVPVVNKTSCGGCNMNLPPQVVNEAMLKKDIVLCGNCARILYCE